MKTLETERLILRELTVDDTKDLFDILSDNETAYWLGMPAMSQRWEAYSMIEIGAEYQYGITRKEENRLIGLLEIYKIDLSSTNAHLGYVLSKEARGSQYMQEAVDAVCTYLFDQTDTDCITLDIRDDNIASRSVAVACGFYLDEELPFWMKRTNFFGYSLDEYNRIRTRKAGSRLSDFLSEGTRAKLLNCCTAA